MIKKMKKQKNESTSFELIVSLKIFSIFSLLFSFTEMSLMEIVLKPKSIINWKKKLKIRAKLINPNFSAPTLLMIKGIVIKGIKSSII